MLITTTQIQIGSFLFDYVHECKVESSWKNLTDTCKIVLPNRLKPNNEWKTQELRKVLKVGDKILIQAGYSDANHVVFEGYITQIGSKVPIELHAQDEMCKLKQNTINDTMPNTTLHQVLQKHFSSYSTPSIDIRLGNFIIQNASQAKILESLQEQFGIYSFFRKSVLVCGLVYEPSLAQFHQYFLPFEYSTSKKDNFIIENELEYKRKEDVKVKVKAISHLPNGQKITIELGDENGEQRTLNFYNLSEKDLKIIAEKEMERIRYDGFKGSFTTFFPLPGQKLVHHGDIVELIAEDNDRSGKYFVDPVEYELGIKGFRQKIYLGPRV